MPTPKKSRVAVDTKLLRLALRTARNPDKNQVVTHAVELYIQSKSHGRINIAPPKTTKMRPTQN